MGKAETIAGLLLLKLLPRVASACHFQPLFQSPALSDPKFMIIRSISSRSVPTHHSLWGEMSHWGWENPWGTKKHGVSHGTFQRGPGSQPSHCILRCREHHNSTCVKQAFINVMYDFFACSWYMPAHDNIVQVTTRATDTGETLGKLVPLCLGS